MAVTSLIDLFLGYDQIPLAEEDRDMTTIITSLGLLCQTIILQGVTNSMAQFMHVITKILKDTSSKAAKVFLNDIGVKGPKSKYNNEEILLGICQYIFKHLINLELTLWLLELAGCVISAEKSEFCMSGVKMVGWVCNYDGRHMDQKKVAKVLDWPIPMTNQELHGFVGLAVYF